MGANVMAVSTDDLSGAKWVVEELGLPFPVLYDPQAKVVSAYGVYDLLGDGYATPSTFIIGEKRTIQWQYIGSHIYDRPSASEVLERLRSLETGA